MSLLQLKKNWLLFAMQYTQVPILCWAYFSLKFERQSAMNIRHINKFLLILRTSTISMKKIPSIEYYLLQLIYYFCLLQYYLLISFNNSIQLYSLIT